MLRLPGVPIIYLGRRSPGASSNLPPDIGRATLQLPVYMVLQPTRCTVRSVSLPSRWALTPPFHPYPCGAVIFCYTCYTLTDIKPLACVALCVARTFLPLLPGGDGADLRGKGSENEHRIKQTRLFFMSSASYPSVKVSENEYRVMSLFDAAVLPGSKA